VQVKEISDTIDHLSFSHDGKKILFDRCREDDCQIQVYDLETGELSAYKSPPNEQWTMARQSYDGKKIVFSIIPIGKDDYLDFLGMQIAVMDTDGKNLRKITTGSFPKLYTTFSHSGKKVLYVKAGRIRKQGRTPASGYDAWEVDIETGKEIRLTYFEYMFMKHVAYFPDDEKFLYYAEGPFAFPGLDLPQNDINKALNMIGEEANKRNIYLVGILTMKRDELYPEHPYDKGFKFGNPPNTPMLSRDGNMYFGLHGSFYLYSLDGKHKPVGGGGSPKSTAISPDGELLGQCYNAAINIDQTKDGKLKVQLYLLVATKTIGNWEEDNRKNPHINRKMIPEQPTRIINR
jgi:hypothetical protein